MSNQFFRSLIVSTLLALTPVYILAQTENSGNTGGGGNFANPMGTGNIGNTGATGNVGNMGQGDNYGSKGQPGNIDTKVIQAADKLGPRPGKNEIQMLPQKLVEPTLLTEFQTFIQSSINRVLPIYGSKLFNDVPTTFSPLEDVPVTPDYLIGPGDELQLRIWGTVEVFGRFTVDRSGNINIPKVGTINVNGIKFENLRDLLKSSIDRIYRNYEFNVTMGALRSIQIFVVGQAARPGGYTVSALSTLINALFASGGPSSIGSMRRIQLKRGNSLVTEIDLYDLISKGDKSKDVRLLPGDVIYIPPVGEMVAVSGSVNLPAIYEMKDKGQLKDLIALAGGFTTNAAGNKVNIERITDRKIRKIQEVPLNGTGLAELMQDGDLVNVIPITSRFDNLITLKGNVSQPARFAWHQGIRVTDLLVNSYSVLSADYWEQQNKGVLNAQYNQQEVNWDYAVVQRLDPILLTTKMYAFNLGKAIRGELRENLLLQPGDIVTIFSNTDTLPETENSVSLKGEFISKDVRRFAWHSGMRITDIIPDAKWLTSYYNYWQNIVPINQEKENKTKVATLADKAYIDPLIAQKKETVITEVMKKESEINWDYASIVRKKIEDLTKQFLAIDLGAVILKQDPQKNLLLQAGDEVIIYTKVEFKVPTTKQRKLVRVEGEVNHAGVYTSLPNETLRQLILRIGGVTSEAYPYATIFIRESTRVDQQKQIDEIVARMEKEMERNTQLAAGSGLIADKEVVKATAEGQKTMIERIRSTKAVGRVVLNLDLNSKITDYPDIVLEDEDRIIIPAKTSVVSVAGSVVSPSSFFYKSDLKVSDYLKQAGGATRMADAGRMYVIRANGSVINDQGYFWNGLGSNKLHPGETLVVPEDLRLTSLTRELSNWTQIISQFVLGAASVKILRQ